MSFATLLVPVDAHPEPDSRLALAIDLANQLGAKLIGMGADFYRVAYYSEYGSGYGSEFLIAAEIDAVAADLKRAEEQFRAAASAVKRGSEWRLAARFPFAEIAAEARAADLVITSTSPRGATEYNVAAAGELVLRAGRPVLVAPANTAHLKVSSVVVAWKDTRETRRAVSDALPFLKAAAKVEVVEICDDKDGAAVATARLRDVAGYLLGHGIEATFEVGVAGKGAGAAAQLLDLAERHEADLIVAGGYGHARLREWVFGGFTRALFVQTRTAVLFSH